MSTWLKNFTTSRFWTYTKYLLSGLVVALVFVVSIMLFRKRGGEVYYARKRSRLYDDYLQAVIKERVKQHAAKERRRLAQLKQQEAEDKIQELAANVSKRLKLLDNTKAIHDDQERRKKLIELMKQVEENSHAQTP